VTIHTSSFSLATNSLPGVSALSFFRIESSSPYPAERNNRKGIRVHSKAITVIFICPLYLPLLLSISNWTGITKRFMWAYNVHVGSTSEKPATQTSESALMSDYSSTSVTFAGEQRCNCNARDVFRRHQDRLPAEVPAFLITSLVTYMWKLRRCTQIGHNAAFQILIYSSSWLPFYFIRYYTISTADTTHICSGAYDL
jgi:hypothetical protein